MIEIVGNILLVAIVAYLIRCAVLRQWKNKRRLLFQEYEQTIDRKKELEDRNETIAAMKIENYDILIIGGGITGVGCALDAASRGLRVALIEANDFGSQASSKTTKLLHGGVRYLDKALRHFDFRQLKLVYEALSERSTVMKLAPYLSKRSRFMLPLYAKWHIPYYWVALKIYDFLSKPFSLGRSYFLNPDSAKMQFSNLKNKSDGSDLTGAMVYHDGVMDDARINIMVAVTAGYHGARIANFVKLVNFTKKAGKIQNAVCIDQLTNQKLIINATCYISATGSFTDQIRSMVTPKKSIMVHSFGTHIVLKPFLAPERMGLVDSNTDDNRMMFIIPWKGVVIAGSTELKSDLEFGAAPTEKEVQFLKNEVQKYNKVEIKDGDIVSAWTGIRPLCQDGSPSSKDIVRRFRLFNDNNNMIVITGGKWTTYRIMAEKTIDMAIKDYKLTPMRDCCTEFLRISGSHGYSADLYYQIADELEISIKYAKHLQNLYGVNAFKFKKYLENFNEKISKKYEFTVAEVLYCIDFEYAHTIGGIVNSRFRIGFVDALEAKVAGEIVLKIMSKYLKWSDSKIEGEIKRWNSELECVGYSIIRKMHLK